MERHMIAGARRQINYFNLKEVYQHNKDDDTSSSELRRRSRDKTSQMTNPSTWHKKHECKEKSKVITHEGGVTDYVVSVNSVPNARGLVSNWCQRAKALSHSRYTKPILLLTIQLYVHMI
jgi:hypothetical protein